MMINEEGGRGDVPNPPPAPPLPPPPGPPPASPEPEPEHHVDKSWQSWSWSNHWWSWRSRGWNQNRNQMKQWQEGKAPWAPRNAAKPTHGRQVKGGFEVDGEVWP